MLRSMSEEQKRIVGWRRTDDRPNVPDTYEITSDTDLGSLDLGDWEPVYSDEVPNPGGQF